MADQRDRQTFSAGTTGTADAVHVFVAGARHIEVDHQIQTVNVQAAGGHIGGHQNFHRTLLEAIDGQLTVLLILLTVQHEDLEFLGHQLAVQAVGLDSGVGEDDGLLISLVGQQPIDQALFVVVVVGGDDLLTGALVKLADAVELQVLRVFQHLANHFTQRRTTTGGGEQQGLARGIAQFAQTLHILGKAHIEHAVGFIEHQHFDFIKQQITGVGVFDQPAWRADQDVHLAQHGSLHLEVFTTGDQASLEEGELGKTLDFLERLLGQLAGRQQDHRAHTHAWLGSAIAEQAIEHGQHKGRRLAATGLRSYPQVFSLQRQRNGRQLHRGGLDKVKLGHGFEQAFMQGELGKHGHTSTKNQQYSGIDYRFCRLKARTAWPMASTARFVRRPCEAETAQTDAFGQATTHALRCAGRMRAALQSRMAWVP